ncbi:hypothetical protein [Sphingomonas immobilis]|uniref:superoxide dismutase n=1 Tax=Sphingomonas immobilis TaxID=3063997 RepID=A0ABT9A2V9_9SPHN|nr:hypothetical protein [Sphingomonas sp. CA1-15]MDO7844179.1 hypothetical protein [Sphingomonas sp. CA1-15]
MADQSRNAVIAQSDLERLVFELPPLPYGTKDLEPVLSAETLEIHHGKHHARYVETLNRLLSEQNFSAPHTRGNHPDRTRQRREGRLQQCSPGMEP